MGRHVDSRAPRPHIAIRDPPRDEKGKEQNEDWSPDLALAGRPGARHSGGRGPRSHNVFPQVLSQPPETERSDASKLKLSNGNSRDASKLRNSVPTAPVAPAIATR